MGDRFPLPVNIGHVDGRAFPLAKLTGRGLMHTVLHVRIFATAARQHGPCDGKWKPVTRQLGPLTRAVESGSGNRA